MQLEHSRFFARHAALCVAMAFATSLAGSATGAVLDEDLADLSLDQLMGITVTSASKKEQNANEVSSAIFVLTQDDIRRSGATSIPEALRLVPGLQVAQTNANSWAVTSRGFNGRFASKLLVLMDGRSVYTPLFSGVYWDVQDTMMEDIERIEVIRGPGATVWGANAVNGVINIITKSSKETQGLLSSAGAGNEETGFFGVRYGGEPIEGLTYRGYAKYHDRDESHTPAGQGANDAYEVARTGFRMDWDASDDDLVTFQGDFYDGEAGMDKTGLTGLSPAMTRFAEDQQIQGWNTIARWTHSFSETQEASVQMYWDRTDRTTPLVDEIRNTFDMEFQHRFSLPFNQEVIWGGGYRYTEDNTKGTFNTGFSVSRRHDDTFSFFVQDEIRFWDEKARLTVGTKVEKNDYTNWEYQPSIRMAVLPHENHTFWGAVSRAVRVPNRADDNSVLNLAFASAGLPGTPNALDPTVLCPPFVGCPATLVQATGVGTRQSKSERVYSFEAGWRGTFMERLTVDVAAFYNDYNDLEDFVLGPLTVTGFVPFSATQNVLLVGVGEAQTYGVELDGRADITEWWRIIIGYTYLRNTLRSMDASHQGLVRSQIDLPFDLEFDATLHLVGNITQHGDPLAISPAANIPSYERLDLRLGWRPTDRIELSLVGQNLLDARHPEYVSELGIAASEIQRSFYGKVTYRY
ncbi:MAG: TonB-dependent receptor [Myxococcales bacterium]|nr:TonB-dependent receptor [Myxococcales bacterium]